MSLHLLSTLTTQAPEAEDVTAGWVGAVVLVGLILAVVFLGFSLVKQLRKAQAAEDAGLYDHDENKKDKRAGWPEVEGTEPTETAENGKPHPST
jgi:TRAP-type C4-dicarboxylate transport system permease small subunit